MKFPGTVTLADATFGGVAREVAFSAISAGFNNVVLMGDHGGGQDALKRVASELDQGVGFKECARLLHSGPILQNSRAGQRIFDRARDDSRTDAGIHDTSEVMFLDKDQKWIRKDKLAPGDEKTGVDGDPRQASAELGKIS